LKAEALSRKTGHVGAVAFSRTGDPATSDFGDATVIRNATFRTTGARFLMELADGCQVIRQDNSRSRSRGGVTPKRFATALFIALVAAAMIASPSLARAQPYPLLREAPPEMEFFRFTARYAVKATGEVIQFDLVRPCRSVTAVTCT
jgi:hypothetical protein